MADDVTASKFLSLVLRHQPEAAGLAMDAEGWVEVEALLAASDHFETHADLERIVRDSDKQRFAFSEDGRRIRARQGHSRAVDLGLVPVAPPEVLWHGTVARFLDAILREGLRPQERQHVHLSPDPETARQVGARRGAPVVLRIASGAMAREGAAFYLSENGVWLTSGVAPAHISRA